MPFSARQGFIGASNVIIDGAFPDYPALPTRLQYANYLANLSANAATTITANIKTPPFGQVVGSMHPMPDGNIYYIPGITGTSRFCSGNLSPQVRTFGVYNPSSNTYIFNEVNAPVQFQGHGAVALDYKIYKPTTDNLGGENGRISRLDLSYWDFSQGNIQSNCVTGPTNTTVSFPDPPGTSNLINGYSSNVGLLPRKTTGALASYRDVVRLPNGEILWIPRSTNSTLAKWCGVEGINATRAGTYTTLQDQELHGACLAPNGKVYIAPNRGRDVVVYDYTSNSTSTIAITGPDSDSYANNFVQLFLSACIDNTGNIILGPDEPEYFGHIDTRTDTFSINYYANVLNTANIEGNEPTLIHGVLGPNGNTYFLPRGASQGGGNEECTQIIEIRGSTGIAKVIANVENFAPPLGGDGVIGYYMQGSAYTDNGNIYAMYGLRFGGGVGITNPSWPFSNTLVINTHANTTIVSGNTHFTYRMSPVGQGAQRGGV